MNLKLTLLFLPSLFSCSPKGISQYEFESKVQECNTNNQMNIGEVQLVSQKDISFPESVVSAGNYTCVSGPASFEINPGEPVFVTCFDRWNGDFVRKFDIQSANPYVPNPGSAMAPGAMGDLYVNIVNPTGQHVARINTLFGFQEQYSSNFADIPPCSESITEQCSNTGPCIPVEGGIDCSDEMGRAPLINSIVALEDGTLFVSDSLQATIWKISPDTKTPEVWISSNHFEGNVYSAFPSGANGLAIGPDNNLYIANTTAGPEFGGAIYRVPLDTPSEDAIELVYSFLPFQIPGVPYLLPEGPDGIKFDIDGNLWVSLAYGNSIAKLEIVDGIVSNEIRLGHSPTDGIPFHQPSEFSLDTRQSVAFIGNHALEPATPDNWALFKMGTETLGEPLQKPYIPWDCSIHDCSSVSWSSIDKKHLENILLEEVLKL